MGELLTRKGQVIIIDDDLVPILSPFTWSTDPNGHVRARIFGELVSIHRYVNKTPKGMSTDHINGNPLDNRRSNLRSCSRHENMRNQKKQNRVTSSVYKGVSWYKNYNKWEAYIKCYGTKKRVGYFISELDAAQAYDEVARKLFGSFACLNFPKEGEVGCGF